MAEVTLGGDRLGSGQKQTVELHNYGMNSFNLEQDWKSSMAPGVLYPCLKLVGTNHGTFDVDIESFIRTIPTRGPLFGSFKFQVDLFAIPFRLYQGILHNNPTDIGLNMNQVYLPKIDITTIDRNAAGQSIRVKGSNEDNWQINESALLKYLGMSGLGSMQWSTGHASYPRRKFQCVPILAYYDIFKNYYSNKQEENAYVITPGEIENVPQAQIDTIRQTTTNGTGSIEIEESREIEWYYISYQYFSISGEALSYNNIQVTIEGQNSLGLTVSLQKTIQELYDDGYIEELEIIPTPEKSQELWNYGPYTMQFHLLRDTLEDEDGFDTTKPVYIQFYNLKNNQDYAANIALTPFELKNIDRMRYKILATNELGSEFVIQNTDDDYPGSWDNASGDDGTGLPYAALVRTTGENYVGGISWNAFTMNGLLVKTYQSDLFNNWLQSDFVDTITNMTKVDTTSGGFTMDTLNLQEKFYNLLNRIIVGSGTYQDWQEAVYGEGAVRMCESPMYIGGMSSEVMFEEVVSTAETNVQSNKQPLGSLGGRGREMGKKGGANIHCKCDEPSYIMAICSLTPRIVQTQGNDWDMTELDTLDDLHKPELDGIGFQDLILEQMAWWSTSLKGDGTVRSRQAVGKQTAWINYQTAVDKAYGDFANTNGYGFMVLNRNYDHVEGQPMEVADVTTYIDPAKYNYAFAYSKLDAQNFWVQIHFKVTARRKMGAQQLPNL